MSKNVAVFVDVANIFYAAKAAGIDIDYVTLLKSATAGRDFVRAYAYTGLDPENENQRQFHSFLARNGYKVISKDIRKYGDGRIKANLDIELVVDMMKTARNLDIAVVVSGDGDFAPAIRAVQEMGVRVEVISFRGNTSSDLIDVADQFTDIAQIARVEKSSGRSGRRVAAEGDLSMTEVPEKETEGAPRRRRGRTCDDRGERRRTRSRRRRGTSRLPGPAITSRRCRRALSRELGAGRHRGRSRRRRGRRRRCRERQRGFSRRCAPRAGAGAVVAAEVEAAREGEGEGRPCQDGVAAAGGADEEDEDFDEPQPQAPHHAFGSVWDSQIGVASPAGSPVVSLAGDFDAEDEDLDEPEVPEYLLAERRQRGQRGGPAVAGRGAPRSRSAYQAALDRERYGNRAPQPSFGGGGGSGGATGPGVGALIAVVTGTAAVVADPSTAGDPWIGAAHGR